MEEKKNRFISVVYQLYSIKDGENTLEEQTSTDRPFEFITGFGIALDALEQRLTGIEKGSTFDFVLQPAEAFGDYDPNGLHKVEREMFFVDGKFDYQHIFEGAVITLTDEEDHHFMAQVKKIEEDGVTLDANHPLAGKTLNFTGLVRENREATEEEIQHLIKQLTGGCSGCGGHGEGGCHEGGCHKDGHEGGCGNCQH